MKYISQKWEEKYDGILYFFQRLEEMLFHYTIDIFIAPVHNTNTLLEEYISVQQDTAKKGVGIYNLEQIRDELVFSIIHDKVLQAKLGNETIELLAKQIKNNNSSVIAYLNRKISKGEYLEWCISYLKEHVVNHSHKEEIEFALRTWISLIIWYGYSQEQIYNDLHRLFSQKISDPYEALSQFIERYSFRENQYKVYYVFNGYYKKYRELLSTQMMISFENDSFTQNIVIKRKNDFVGAFEVKAIDKHNALKKGYSIILLLEQFIHALSNEKREMIRSTGMVRDLSKEDDCEFIRIKNPGSKAIFDDTLIQNEETINYVIVGYLRSNKNTRGLLSNAIKLHNSANAQLVPKEAFIELWSMLEALVITGPCDSKIELLTSKILPMIQDNYMREYFSEIDTGIQNNISSQEYQELLKDITIGKYNIDKLMYMVFLPEYEGVLERCFSLLKQYPIIRHKMYTMYSIRNKTSDVYKKQSNYANRIKWHLYRLYRARNALVHSGDTHRHIEVLGRHLHAYCDKILIDVMLKISSDSTMQTIEDVFCDGNLRFLSMRRMATINDPITTEIIEEINKSFFILPNGYR